MILFIKCLTKLAEQQCEAIGDGYRRLYRQVFCTLFNVHVKPGDCKTRSSVTISKTLWWKRMTFCRVILLPRNRMRWLEQYMLCPKAVVLKLFEIACHWCFF